MKKNSKSPIKQEPKATRAKAQRPAQRETMEVLAELVEKLRGKLELKATPPSPGKAGQRPELSRNLDRLTVGVDLGDQWSRYCILDLHGETLSEGPLQTRQAELADLFQALPPARVVIEVGTHSPWVQEIIAGEGSPEAGPSSALSCHGDVDTAVGENLISVSSRTATALPSFLAGSNFHFATASTAAVSKSAL